ncbi:hypothetical protein BGZ63DRAFT_435476 [Mariannaea sp. PMI_226]|nr:hypothetical protein BGZ63DRAFT_435476 [Mariannaea sp. PMI_226]
MDPKKFFGNFRKKISRSGRSDLSTAKNSPFVPEASTSRSPATQDPFPDAPPAYTPTAGPTENPQHPDSRSLKSRFIFGPSEDKYAFLSSFDTIFVIDDSSSMRYPSRSSIHSSKTRWVEVQNALDAVLPICTSHDPDGIDIYFLNHKSKDEGSEFRAAGGYHNIYSHEQVQVSFEEANPQGATPTGTCLNRILRPYLKNLKANKNSMEDVKPVNIIVITDGMPTDNLEEIVIHYAKMLDELMAPPHQVGIQFFQVGDNSEATRSLDHLDNEISKKSNVRDMVDTVAWKSVKSGKEQSLSADSILKVVLGAVMRKLDEKPVK